MSLANSLRRQNADALCACAKDPSAWRVWRTDSKAGSVKEVKKMNKIQRGYLSRFAVWCCRLRVCMRTDVYTADPSFNLKAILVNNKRNLMRCVHPIDRCRFISCPGSLILLLKEAVIIKVAWLGVRIISIRAHHRGRRRVFTLWMARRRGRVLGRHFL